MIGVADGTSEGRLTKFTLTPTTFYNFRFTGIHYYNSSYAIKGDITSEDGVTIKGNNNSGIGYYFAIQYNDDTIKDYMFSSKSISDESINQDNQLDINMYLYNAKYLYTGFIYDGYPSRINVISRYTTQIETYIMPLNDYTDDNVSEIQNQVETLYNENETNKATIESLNNQITTLNNQIDSLNNQVTTLNSQITEKDKSIAQKDLKILSLNNEVIKLQNQITTLQNQINTLQTEYNETYNKLQLIEQTSTTILDSPFYNSQWYVIFANESQEWNMPIEYLNTLFNANSEKSIYKKNWKKVDANPYLEYVILQYNSQEYIMIKATREYMREEYQSLKYSTTTFSPLNLIENICNTEWDNGTTIGTQFGTYNYVIGKYDTTVESNIISFQQGTDVSNFYVGNFNESFGKVSGETSQPGATYTYYSSEQSILSGTTIISAYGTNYTTDQFQTDMNCNIMFDSSVAKAIKAENQVLNTYKKQLAEKEVELEEKTKELSETTQNYENRITALKEEIENLNEQIINGTSSLDKLLINTGAEVPMQILKSILNFEILGVNCFGLVTSIITCLVVLWLVKKFMK